MLSCVKSLGRFLVILDVVVAHISDLSVQGFLFYTSIVTLLYWKVYQILHANKLDRFYLFE